MRKQKQKSKVTIIIIIEIGAGVGNLSPPPLIRYLYSPSFMHIQLLLECAVLHLVDEICIPVHVHNASINASIILASHQGEP
jgi:hypothetical protein